jgi:Cu(I)-responsive transcriptional regulator
MNLMTIGQIARQAGTAVATIRYYEQQGLIPPPERSPSGYRQFPPDTIKRLRFIERAKNLGFSLNDVHGLMDLEDQPAASSADVKARVINKIEEINQKLDELSRMRDSLVQLADKCDGKSDLEHCPILDCLNQDEPE